MSDHQPRIGKYVCGACIEDDALAKYVNANGRPGSCDYCGNDPIPNLVILLDDIVEHMSTIIAQERCDPAATSPVDKGEYLLPTIDASELLEAIGFEVSSDEVMADVEAVLSEHDWCDADWTTLNPSDRAKHSWKRFEEIVKHERRYTFWHAGAGFDGEEDDELLSPDELLQHVQEGLNGVELVKPQPVGTEYWRLQLHLKTEKPVVPNGYTSPPLEYATQPNRMSPGGIPMFYGADDFHTAKLELTDPKPKEAKKKMVSGMKFKTVVPFNVLDLTDLPNSPSYFSPKGPHLQHFVVFLRQFAETVSKPIARDHRQHIEYVPTQVFTEFVRYLMMAPGGAPIHGIRYRSSKDKKPCCVIFATQEQCLPPSVTIPRSRKGSQLLEPVPASLREEEV